MIYSAKYYTPQGGCLLAADDESLIGLWFNDQKYFCPLKEEPVPCENNVLKKSVEWLDEYFSGENPAISRLSLKPEGSSFRKEVWEILMSIPYGEVMTYGEIAKIIAQRHGKAKMSAQAVGGAVGHNPISIIIPCHRVVGANGSLIGYAGGIDKKIWLLRHEGIQFPSGKD